MTTITPEVAGKMYDILVEHAGAPEVEYDRHRFIYSHSRGLGGGHFRSALGFNSKFWRITPWWETETQHLAEAWYVNCCPEDRTPEREEIIKRTNAALTALNEKVGPRREW